MSLRGLERWTFTARMLAMALAGFALTVLFGLLLAINRLWVFLPPIPFPLVHAHFHLALLGWVLPMVIGVAARVYPMFLLAREPSGWPGRVQLWGLGLGVPAVVLGILASRTLLAAGTLAVAAAVLAHVAWVCGMVRGRRRPALDWGLRLVLTGALALVPATGLALALALDVLAGPRVALAYAALALGAWASLTIAGMMLKIVPFLVWYRVYAPHAGRQPVPTLAQLSSPTAERLAYGGLTGGVLALTVAVAAAVPAAIEAAGIVVAVGALAFAAALGRILLHLLPHAAARRATPLRARP
jgi:hypothetical protein